MNCSNKILYIFLLSIFMYNGCTSQKLIEQPEVVNGFLDLKNHDFDATPLVPLKGTWLFFPEMILSPEEAEIARQEGLAVPIKVPGPWYKQVINGEKGPVFGKGTYYISIDLPNDAPELSFLKNLLHDSFKLFINGEPQRGLFVSEKEQEHLVRANKPEYFDIPFGVENLTLVLQTSNYWDQYGAGLHVTPDIGTKEELRLINGINIGYESFIMGFLLLTAMYHLMLYSIQRKDKALLYFALISLAVLFRQMATSEKFWFSMFGMNNTTILRFEHGTAYLICALFSLYFMYIFPKHSIKSMCLSIFSIAVLFLIFALFTPIQFFSLFVTPLHTIIILTSLNGFFMLGRALIKKEPEAHVMIFGLLALFIPTFIDILITAQFIIGRYIMPLGLIPFIMAQSFFLAKRYTRDAGEAESLRVEAAHLAELDKIKTNFLANVSHELRTPITLIKAPIESISSGEYGEQISRSDPVFTLIQGNVTRLLRLIENLLHITRLESIQVYELIPTDLGQIIPAYLKEFEPLAQTAHITLSYEVDQNTKLKESKNELIVNLDKKAFETIFFNLLSNAFKFTPQNGSITIGLDSFEENNQWYARISITDTGCGIHSNEISNIFKRYKQIYDNERHHYEGSGLGLSIVAGTVESLGGKVWVESELGKGSSFYVSFPILEKKNQENVKNEVDHLAKNSHQIPEIIPVSFTKTLPLDKTIPIQKSKKHILVVEDHPDLRKFIVSGLEKEYAVSSAENGVEALQLLEKTNTEVDLILSDIMMPLMDGIALFETVKANPLLSGVPFIFLTARDEPNDRVTFLNKGVIYYIVKPFVMKELLAKITTVLQFRETERNRLLKRITIAMDGILPNAIHKSKTYPEDLSKREIEILKLIVEGKQDKEIADMLGIARRTASNHVAAILKKTGLSSRQSIQKQYE